ncbi:hypothetical protein FFLO_02685 [Filobasidium floriforme]|uniref:Dienelactone hydrolase domain-containing protein n=1 Tax=Filobasidium floriforme TaxID=5210 RepID=A0A8K0JNM9_9TREE|nr:hypothetical protein FFLO_02685 [Filobasidium floriforme]
MPDFLHGKPWPEDNFPPKTDQDKQKLQEFFGTTANVGDRLAELKSVASSLKSEGYTHISLYGFCWGGKVATVAAGEKDLFKSVAIVHPAMLDVKDVDGIDVPFGFYPSKDEPSDTVKEFQEALSKKAFADKNDYKHYEKMHHGWAAARADLKDPENKKAFEDVYGRLATFFGPNNQ